MEKPIERKYIKTKNILMLEALRIDLGIIPPKNIYQSNVSSIFSSFVFLEPAAKLQKKSI